MIPNYTPVKMNLKRVRSLKELLGDRFEILVGVTVLYFFDSCLLDEELEGIVRTFASSSLVNSCLDFITGTYLCIVTNITLEDAEKLEKEHQNIYLIEDREKVNYYRELALTSYITWETSKTYYRDRVKAKFRERTEAYKNNLLKEKAKEKVVDLSTALILKNQELADAQEDLESLGDISATQEDHIIDLEDKVEELEGKVEELEKDLNETNNLLNKLRPLIDQFTIAKNWFNKNTPTQKEIGDAQGVSQSTISRRLSNISGKINKTYKLY